MSVELGFGGLLVVAAVAVVAPLVVAAVPRLRIPGIVVEILAGIVVGPSVLGWVEVDEPIAVLALVGLAFLLFLAGLEIDLLRLRGAFLRLPLAGYAVTLALGVVAGLALDLVGWVRNPLFLAVAVSGTALGIVVTVVKEAGAATHPAGLMTVAGATVADFSGVILLSLLFSEAEGSTASKLLALGLFVLVIAAVTVTLLRAGRSMRIDRLLTRLQDTTAEIRVRLAVLLLLGFVALAATVGLEAILGAFIAGAVLGLVDRDAMSHPHFRVKLEAIGYGFLIPVFFVASGLRFELDLLTESPSALARVPVFLLIMLVVRGLPALLYRPATGTAGARAAGLLQAASLPFIVTATEIGTGIGAIEPATGAGLIAAGLLSVVLFPPVASGLLRRAGGPPAPGPEPARTAPNPQEDRP